MDTPEIIPPPDARRTRAGDPLEGYKVEVPAEVIETTNGRRPRLRYAHGLNPQEARFATRYLTHGNAQRAMREAGYVKPAPTEKNAQDLLADERIAAVIEEQTEAIADLYRVTRGRLVAEHARIALSNIADFEDVLTAGEDAISTFNALPRGTRAAVKKVKITRRYDGKGEDATPVDTLELEFHDKQRSMDALAKITELYTPPEDELAGSFAQLLDAAARKIGLDP